MNEVIPGIFQMTLTLSGFNPGSINVYLLEDQHGYTLIDTGWDVPPAVDSMMAQLAEFHIQFSDIKRVLITHSHIDHLGMSARFKEANQATIFYHKNEVRLLEIRFQQGDQYLPLTDSFLKLHGMPEIELTPPEVQLPKLIRLVQPDGLLEGGEEIQVGQYNLRVINTPGHTPGHVSYYEPHKKFLISGDILLPTIITNAAIHVQHFPNPLRQHLNSLRQLRELEINQVLPGHEHIFSNHRQRIDELILHHNQKAAEILKMMTEGQNRTVYEISRKLSWTPRTRLTAWNNLTGWDKRFAVLQTIAHLEDLTTEGRVTRFSQDGKLYYR